jgi:hypothetical protein
MQFLIFRTGPRINHRAASGGLLAFAAHPSCRAPPHLSSARVPPVQQVGRLHDRPGSFPLKSGEIPYSWLRPHRCLARRRTTETVT